MIGTVKPRISIVIPTLNEEGHIAQAVARARALEPHEVIVADGRSTDATFDAARQAGAQVVLSPPGRGTQLNAGAQRATGDVLLFLHADNWLVPQAAAQIAHLMGNPQVSGGGFFQRIDAPEPIYRLIEQGNALRARTMRLFYGDQAIFIRRDVFHQVGGFPNVPLMEDVLLSRRLRRHRMVLLPGPLHVSARRWKRHGVLRQTLRNWMLVGALTAGASPERLARFYPHHANPEK